MNITVIDGQGGSLGKALIEQIIANIENVNITAVGTNSAATAAMKKGGAQICATGENPVKVACKKAEVIVGPIGIICADAMHGEITPQMAMWVGQSEAVKVLIPVNGCSLKIAGAKGSNMASYIKAAIDEIKESCSN